MALNLCLGGLIVILKIQACARYWFVQSLVLVIEKQVTDGLMYNIANDG